jgi:hypothetical protein
MEGPQEIKNSTRQSCYTTPDHTSEGYLKPMFIAILFTIPKLWNHPKCPSTYKWIKKMWYIYSIDYFFSHKEELIHVIFRKLDGTGDQHVKWNKPDWERQISYVLANMQNLDLKKENEVWNGDYLVGEEGKPVRVGRAKREDDGGSIWLMYFIWIYKNKIMKPIKII